MCGGSTTYGKSSLFWVVFRAHRHSHLNSAPHSHQSPQEAKHSIPLRHPLWPGDDLPGYKAASAKSHFLITENPDLPSAAFQAGRNTCLLAIFKSQSTGVFRV